MASTLTTFDAVLFERYYKDRKFVDQLLFEDNQLLGMLEKKGDTGMVGDQMPIPVQYSLPQGHGGVFSTAQTNEGNTTWARFVASCGDYFGVVDIGDKVMMASRNNNGAFLENKVAEVDGLYQTVAENLSIHLWGNGGGAKGQVASISSNTITLTDPEDAANFEVNEYVVFSANDGATATDSVRAGSTYITTVNIENGTLVVNDLGDVTGEAAGDYIFTSSAFIGDSGQNIIRGVQAWITATNAPDALWSVTAATRALSPHRLAGCRVPVADLAGKGIDERIKTLFARMRNRYKSKRPDYIFLNPEDLARLDTLLSANGRRELEREKTDFGYEGIVFRSVGGRSIILDDRHCPLGTAFAFNSNNHWMTSMGELIHPQLKEGQGMLMLRDSATDWEVRLISYPIYVNNKPVNHGRVPLYSGQ